MVAVSNIPGSDLDLQTSCSLEIVVIIYRTFFLVRVEVGIYMKCLSPSGLQARRSLCTDDSFLNSKNA